MNATPQIPETEPANAENTAVTQAPPVTTPPPPDQNQNQNQEHDCDGAPSSGNRHNGKISRFPKTTRDQINIWLRDGVTYADIIERLGDLGKDLTIDNVSQWKKRGYQDWLLEQAFLGKIRSRQETPSDLARDFDATEVNHAALQLGSLHIFEALRELGPGTLDEKLGGDSAAFSRLINSLARVNRETLEVQKYRDACAQARAALKPRLDSNRKFTDAENRALVRRVDELLGIVSPDPPPSDSNPASTPPANPTAAAAPTPAPNEQGPPQTAAPLS
jgi:hypothetical protein